jgi:hypothetical protein
MNSVFWSSVIGAAGVVVGAALSQVVTWLNAKQARKDQQADLARARRERMNDLEREVGVKLVVALDHAIGLKLSEDTTADTEVIRASCEELQIVGREGARAAAEVIARAWYFIKVQLETTHVADEGTVEALMKHRDDLREALRQAHWSPTSDVDESGDPGH